MEKVSKIWGTFQRVSVFIDGSNLYYKLKDLNIKNKTEFDYFGFCNLLSGSRRLASCKYYVGAIRADRNNEKARIMRANQQRLFSHLEKQGLVVEKGFLLESNGVFHEKGVDVKIATDMIIGAYENHYDVAALISSDTDLIPAIKQVRKLGKIVEHIGFSHAPSFGLKKHTNITRLLAYDDLKEFIKEEGVELK
jgi:uncharacterized LabA/DUF88 family protein